MKKIYFLLLFLAGVNFSYGQLIINEVLYDPSNNALDGDANRDGIYSQDDDSFIEIYNGDTADFDISGYEIWDDTATGGSIQFRFPPNTLVPAGDVVVVFGGGTPTGSFGTGVILVGDSGLNFNNSGEVIGVKDGPNGAWALIFDSDALSNNPNESYTRNPDITGAFEQHGDNFPRLFSPGYRVDSTAFRTSTGILEKQSKIELNLYPNPVRDFFYLNADKKIDLVEVFKLNGQKVMEMSNVSRKVDVTDLPGGVYLLRARSGESLSTIRFVKQ
jgi:hypothetical protein